MTNKIKSAREDVQAWVDDLYTEPSYTLLAYHYETILKALSAHENLQGVDFEELVRVTDTVCSSRILHGARAYYLPEDIEILENAARILADINKEERN